MRLDAGRTGVEAARRAKAKDPAGRERSAKSYAHPEASSLLRTEVGTQAQFRKKRPPATLRYGLSRSPAFERDQQNPAREHAEAKLAAIADRMARLWGIVDSRDSGDVSGSILAELREETDATKAETAELKKFSEPFLNWAGRAERPSLDVPTLTQFVHEHLSTSAILDTEGPHPRPARQV